MNLLTTICVMKHFLLRALSITDYISTILDHKSIIPSLIRGKVVFLNTFKSWIFLSSC